MEQANMPFLEGHWGIPLGLGTDLVDIDSFRRQLELSGSVFQLVFTARERRQVMRRARISGDEVPHFAVRWAAKEAFIKAWSAVLAPGRQALELSEIRWEQIETVSDPYGRPRIELHPQLRQIVDSSFGGKEFKTLLSMTHDGPFALATVIITTEKR